MPVPVECDDRLRLVVRRPLPGVTVARFAGDRPLMRAVPDRFGTTMHISGRSHWTSGRTQWSSGPGSVSAKVPGEVSIENAREGRFDFQVVLFEPSLVDQAAAALERPMFMPRTRAVHPLDPGARPLGTLHRRLLAEETPDDLEGLVCEALHALVDAVCGQRGEKLGRYSLSVPVARARTMLDERFTEPVDLDELSAHARLDKFRLCRAFREQVGLPPHAYVTHRRIALAQALLARGISQAEVAARVGFYDQSLLHRHFKRILGLTPGAFSRASA